MRITVLAVGQRMPAWIQEGVREYAKRMPPEARVELVEVKAEERSAGKGAARAVELEGERLLAALPERGTLLALDERGRGFTTQGLAVMMSEWMREGANPAFAIGGADGLSEAVKARAEKLLSLSQLTLPHGMVRVLLAEQLYRAWSILARHPYHRE